MITHVFPPPPPSRPSIYRWLQRHAWLVTLFIITIAAIGTWVNSLKPPAAQAPTPAAAIAPAPLDPEAQKKADRLARAEKLHKVEVEKHPEATSFLFADYEAPEPGQYRGWVYIYSATKNHFVERDRQSCSYPDGTHIVVDFEQRTMLMSCNFPDFMTPKKDGDKEISTGIVTIRFFDNDEQVYGTFACSCVTVLISNPVFDAANRTLDATIVAAGVTQPLQTRPT